MNILTEPSETPVLKEAREDRRWITTGRTTSTALTGTTRRRTPIPRWWTGRTLCTARTINISHLQRDLRLGSGQSLAHNHNLNLSLSLNLRLDSFRKLLPKNSTTVREPSDPLAISIGKFSCSSCGKGFPQAYRLRRHVREVHDKEKMYQCDECDKKFFKTNSLTRHKISVHEQKRPFS